MLLKVFWISQIEPLRSRAETGNLYEKSLWKRDVLKELSHRGFQFHWNPMDINGNLTGMNDSQINAEKNKILNTIPGIIKKKKLMPMSKSRKNCYIW